MNKYAQLYIDKVGYTVDGLDINGEPVSIMKGEDGKPFVMFPGSTSSIKDYYKTRVEGPVPPAQLNKQRAGVDRLDNYSPEELRLFGLNNVLPKRKSSVLQEGVGTYPRLADPGAILEQSNKQRARDAVLESLTERQRTEVNGIRNRNYPGNSYDAIYNKALISGIHGIKTPRATTEATEEVMGFGSSLLDYNAHKDPTTSVGHPGLFSIAAQLDQGMLDRSQVNPRTLGEIEKVRAIDPERFKREIRNINQSRAVAKGVTKQEQDMSPDGIYQHEIQSAKNQLTERKRKSGKGIFQVHQPSLDTPMDRAQQTMDRIGLNPTEEQAKEFSDYLESQGMDPNDINMLPMQQTMHLMHSFTKNKDRQLEGATKRQQDLDAEFLDGPLMPLPDYLKDPVSETPTIIPRPQADEQKITEKPTALPRPQADEQKITEKPIALPRPQASEQKITEKPTIIRKPQVDKQKGTEKPSIIPRPQADKQKGTEKPTIIRKPQADKQKGTEKPTIIRNKGGNKTRRRSVNHKGGRPIGGRNTSGVSIF